MPRNDREAAFSLAETEVQKQLNAQRGTTHGRYAAKPGPRPIRQSRAPLVISVWTWLALSFFVPLVSVLLFNHFKG